MPAATPLLALRLPLPRHVSDDGFVQRDTKGVVKAVNAAKQFAVGVVGLTSWEDTFGPVLQRLQSLVVASMTLGEGGSPADDAIPQYLAYEFSQIRVKAEIPCPPMPESGDFPGYARCASNPPLGDGCNMLSCPCASHAML